MSWRSTIPRRASRRRARPAFRSPICASIDWSKIAALVLAPGVPLTHPAPHWTVGLARNAAVEVIGDIELFCRERRKTAPDAPFVAITGTNGKSTTTALVAHLLASANYDVQLGGNIGTAILSLQPPAPGRVHVIECSSFQIDLAPTLDPSVGILLNVTEDHLDRHGTLKDYAAIKERLVANAATAIVGVDDNWSQAVADRIDRAGKRVVRVSVRRPLSDGIYVEGDQVMRAAGGTARAVVQIGGIGSLRGLHNAQNAACATGAALALGLSAEAIQQRACVVSRPRAPHGAGGAQGRRAVRQRLQGDQCGRRRARACELHGHFLDRGRQGQDRRHHVARRLFPAHPQGLPDRRGGGRIRRHAAGQGAVRGRRHARPRGGACGGAMPRRPA